MSVIKRLCNPGQFSVNIFAKYYLADTQSSSSTEMQSGNTAPFDSTFLLSFAERDFQRHLIFHESQVRNVHKQCHSCPAAFPHHLAYTNSSMPIRHTKTSPWLHIMVCRLAEEYQPSTTNCQHGPWITVHFTFLCR